MFRNDKEWIHYPRRNEKRSAFISGAGDVFLAALAMATVQGASLEVSCMAANETVSAVEGRIGTMAADAATWKEVIKYIYKKRSKGHSRLISSNARMQYFISSRLLKNP